MSKKTVVWGLAVAAATIVAACSDVPVEESQTSTVDSSTSTTVASVASEDLRTPSTLIEVDTVSEEIEPVGAVEGGNVANAYLGEGYPRELTILIDPMRQDLSERTGLSTSEIVVVSVEEVTWSDASLGCPQPDMVYAQVLTDGLRVILEAGGSYYDYRSGGDGGWILCVEAPVTDKSTAGVYELTEDGVVQVEPPKSNEKAPTEGINPPDE